MEIILLVSLCINAILFVACMDFQSDLKRAKREYEHLESRYEILEIDKNFYEKLAHDNFKFSIESNKNLNLIKEILYSLKLRHGQDEVVLDSRSEKVKDYLDVEITDVPDNDKTIKVTFKTIKLS